MKAPKYFTDGLSKNLKFLASELVSLGAMTEEAASLLEHNQSSVDINQIAMQTPIKNRALVTRAIDIVAKYNKLCISRVHARAFPKEMAIVHEDGEIRPSDLLEAIANESLLQGV